MSTPVPADGPAGDAASEPDVHTSKRTDYWREYKRASRARDRAMKVESKDADVRIAVASPEVEADPQETINKTIAVLKGQADADSAANALKAQIAALHESEAHNRRQMERQQHQQAELQRLAFACHTEASRRGFQEGTPEHTAAAQDFFRAELARQQGQPLQHAAAPIAHHQEPVMDEIPEPANMPMPRTPSPDDRQASYVSAPVSREHGSGHREPSRSQVTLSADQRMLAKSLGISDIEMAKQVRRLEDEKKAGIRQL